MIIFPNCKINLGLYVTKKRNDGYHDLATVFYPVKQLFDVLEIVESKQLQLTVTGTDLQISTPDNIVVKAHQLLQRDFKIPAVDIHLHKHIPHGAGLGGGSADASFMIQLCNDYFQLQLTQEQLLQYALQLGSDCPFFIYNTPCIAYGRGEVLQHIDLNVSNYKMVIVKPNIHIATKDAFNGVAVLNEQFDIEKMIQLPITEWKNTLENVFEKTIFKLHPTIEQLKQTMYNNGAIYTSMSGTGSAVYGLFDAEIEKDVYTRFGEVFTT
jgi:4-diphosphocytidyl-2-C-methyl-D-erythritol kinase